MTGIVLLTGIAFGLFVFAIVPFTMFEKAQAEKWPARKGVITLSYASHKRDVADFHLPRLVS